MRARGLKAKLYPIVEIIVAIGTSLVLWFGARMVLDGTLSSGSLVVFILYLGKMYKPMQDLSKMTNAYSKAAVGYERIREVLEMESDVKDLPGARPAPRFKGQIEFDNVTFGYDAERPIFQGLSLRVEPGQVAALVGPTGAGKSSVFSLLSRFYDALSGSSQDRRAGYQNLYAEIAARANQFRAAGDDSLSRSDLEEHCLRQAGGDARGDHQGCAAGERGRVHQ
jgi:subfamily B ATP-binding cassette protein MsbA